MNEPQSNDTAIYSNLCRNCRFFNWEERPAEDGTGGLGRCYRYPRQRALMPQHNAITNQMQIGEICNYPLQSADDWCGEFAPADQSAVQH